MRTPSWLRRNLASIVLFLALLLLWQVAVSVLGMRAYILPSPAAVLRALLSFEIPWFRHLWVTTAEILGGFVVAGAVGVALGIGIAWSPLLARALVPFLVFVNTLPKVAVAPLFLLWLGYGIIPNILIAALIGFFPVVINTAVGLTQVDEELLDLGRVFGAPKWKVFVKIRIPNGLPYILSALKITATAVVVGAIVGEFVAAESGIGRLLLSANGNMDTELLFAGLLALVVVGLVLFLAMEALERLMVPWRVSQRVDATTRATF